MLVNGSDASFPTWQTVPREVKGQRGKDKGPTSRPQPERSGHWEGALATEVGAQMVIHSSIVFLRNKSVFFLTKIY
jgi:hypothetical protein